MSKWVSIQSLLAAEEDRQQKDRDQQGDRKGDQDRDRDRKKDQDRDQKGDQDRDQDRNLASPSLVPDTSLVSGDHYAYRDTSLVSDTSLVPNTSLSDKSSPEQPNLWNGLLPVKGHTKFYNQIIDQLYRYLDPYEQAVYTQLYRLSLGYGKDSCFIGLPKLAERANISTTAVQQAIKRLSQKGLIEKISWQIGKGKDQGTEYRLVFGTSLISEDLRLVPNTSLVPDTTIKDHDDLLKRKDHQNARARMRAHARETMMIYQSITGNQWHKYDDESYEKIKNIEIEKIEEGIRLANNRAATRPNSLSYFVKEILNIANPSSQSKTQQKKRLETVIANVRVRNVGNSNYTTTDFVEDVKRECAKEGIPFNNDLFNQIVKI